MRCDESEGFGWEHLPDECATAEGTAFADDAVLHRRGTDASARMNMALRWEGGGGIALRGRLGRVVRGDGGGERCLLLLIVCNGPIPRTPLRSRKRIAHRNHLVPQLPTPMLPRHRG